jgi:hypothetical protein
MSNYFLNINEYEDFLSILGERLASRGASYDIVVAGGFAINRFYQGNRSLTHDLDFQFIRPVDSEEDSLLLNLVAEIAREYDLSPDWFNVCEFIIEGLATGLTHAADYGSLSVFVPDAFALIAAKTISFRDREGEAAGDIQDLCALFGFIGCVLSFEELLENAEAKLPSLFMNLTDADIAERRNKYQRYFGEQP